MRDYLEKEKKREQNGSHDQKISDLEKEQKGINLSTLTKLIL